MKWFTFASLFTLHAGSWWAWSQPGTTCISDIQWFMVPWMGTVGTLMFSAAELLTRMGLGLHPGDASATASRFGDRHAGAFRLSPQAFYTVAAMMNLGYGAVQLGRFPSLYGGDPFFFAVDPVLLPLWMGTISTGIGQGLVHREIDRQPDHGERPP